MNLQTIWPVSYIFGTKHLHTVAVHSFASEWDNPYDAITPTVLCGKFT